MPTVSLPNLNLSGKDVKEIVNAIERQRKELEFLLAHLDDDNVKKLSAFKINVGNSNLEVWSGGIDLSVSDLSGSMSALELRSDSIELSVSGLDTRLGTAEASITIQAGQISSKVSSTDYNGDTIASLINQTATTITLSASKIDLLGITKVASEIQLGNVGDTDMKAIKFRGSDAWIYSTTDLFTISAAYPIKYYGPKIDFSGVGNLDMQNMTVLAWNTNWDFEGSTVTGLYARFG